MVGVSLPPPLLWRKADPSETNPAIEHAGIDLKKATFLDRKSFKEHTTLVLEWIASQIKDKPNVVGLELLNEPNPDDHRRINPWCEY